MRDFMAITKALSDDNRVRVLLALRSTELCVCQIIELLDLAPSTISKHMSVLKQARLVECEKNGRWIYYRLMDGNAPVEAREAIELVLRNLSADPQIKSDAERLKDIVKRNPIEVCRQQRGK